MALLALAAGLTLAVAAALGGVWLIRAGVALLAVGAVIAVWLLIRESDEQRSAHSATLAHTSRAHRDLMYAERRRNGEVLAVLRDHNSEADKAVRELEERVAELNDELAELETHNGQLAADLIERETTIARLRRDLAAREAELAAIREADSHAEVVSMPRHGVSWDALPTVEEVFADGDHPAVIDLRTVVPATEATRKQA